MTATPGFLQSRLRAAYDAQLRDSAEVMGADSVSREGPLWLARFGSHGFVTYRSLNGLGGTALDDLIARTISFFAGDPLIRSFEWKTRGHDTPGDLVQRLTAHGFRAQEPETVMVGEARLLATDVALPAGVCVRRIDNAPAPARQLIGAAAAQTRIFGRPCSAQDLERRLSGNPGNVEIWVAETAAEVISVGRLEFVVGSEFAGLWGAGTLPEWRGRGIYRALTAARARSALTRGIRFLHSDCTEDSRPILERSGLIAITTTQPLIWSRMSAARDGGTGQ